MAEQRLIDVEAFHKFIEKQDEGADYTIYHFKEWIKQQPIIEARPVVHAHWTDEITDCWHCSNCLHPVLLNGAEEYVFSNYCPHCGAQMDEEENDK